MSLILVLLAACINCSDTEAISVGAEGADGTPLTIDSAEATLQDGTVLDLPCSDTAGGDCEMRFPDGMPSWPVSVTVTIGTETYTTSEFFESGDAECGMTFTMNATIVVPAAP